MHLIIWFIAYSCTFCSFWNSVECLLSTFCLSYSLSVCLCMKIL
jgi:hypothetical protein